jgi:hypothetical protein
MPPPAGHEYLFHVVDELDRLAGHFGKHDRAEISCQGIVFRASKTPTDKRLNNSDFVEGEFEAVCEVAIDKIGALLGGPYGYAR